MKLKLEVFEKASQLMQHTNKNNIKINQINNSSSNINNISHSILNNNQSNLNSNVKKEFMKTMTNFGSPQIRNNRISVENECLSSNSRPFSAKGKTKIKINSSNIKNSNTHNETCITNSDLKTMLDEVSFKYDKLLSNIVKKLLYIDSTNNNYLK